jgi:hypothetical protein
MPRSLSLPSISRREVIRILASAAGYSLLPPALALADLRWKPSSEEEAFLDELERRGCLFFWEQASERTGQVLDRARNDLGGGRDPRRMASIASTGFGLTALSIADHRGYLARDQVVERIKATLSWHLNSMPEVHGFFYHFTDFESGARWSRSEVSSIDTSILLCGILTAKAHFNDPQISSLAQQIYERVDWPWLLDGGTTFSMGWQPESGFIPARWDHYCELMMIYLLALGSPSHPVSPETWDNFTRPEVHHNGYSYISGHDPLFTHQYSQAWFDFRNRRDAYANYFDNSVTATRAHRAFCLSHPEWYSDDYWGVSASDSVSGYRGWGGPPAGGQPDGTAVPCAAAGSLPFLPPECLAVLRAMRSNFGKRAWGRYGFVDAFHPAADWYDPDVIGIDQGISVLMAENLRSGFVWNTFMRNRESVSAMQLAGFKGSGLEEEAKNLREKVPSTGR